MPPPFAKKNRNKLSVLKFEFVMDAHGNVYIRGVIKKFVDCLYQIKTP